MMKEKLEQLLAEGKQRIASVATETELQDIKAALLGKQGSLTELMKELPKLDVSLRPEMGKAVNQAKAQLTELRRETDTIQATVDGIEAEEKTAREDACKVEHDVSEKTFAAICSHVARQESM